jgi:hypothetical protein
MQRNTGYRLTGSLTFLGFAVAAFVAIILNLSLSEEIEFEETEPESAEGEGNDGVISQAGEEPKGVGNGVCDEEAATQLPG